MAVDPSVDDVLAVIELAVSDTSVPEDVRNDIAALRGDVEDGPSLAYERICRIGLPATAAMATASPMTNLYRAVTIPVFRFYCARPEYRAVSDLAFLGQVRAAPAPDDFLTDALDSSVVVFPAEHSWLVDAPDIESRAGGELPALLQLRNNVPPFALCRLTVSLMESADVKIRRPTGLDAAIGLHPQWHPAGIPAGTEFVDHDVRGSAIDQVLWRP